MKKKLFILCMALVCTVTLMAQNISVVTANGTTTIVRTLDEAIAIVNENPGCVVYLPGGGHSISTGSKITKKVTIIGIGHKIKGENVDGFTTINGSIRFYEGSDGSALLGCYVTDSVKIGIDNAVNGVLVRYCNVKCICVYKQSQDTEINQCYIRGTADYNGYNGSFTHNIAKTLLGLQNGFIEYNIFTSQVGSSATSSDYILNSSLIGNIFITPGSIHIGSNCQTADNACIDGTAGGSINIGTSAADVFVNPAGANSTSDYHFNENYNQYQNTYGPYVGNQFNGTGLPPVPYIVAKQIPMETDASGNLNIKIRVKAGGEE